MLDHARGPSYFLIVQSIFPNVKKVSSFSTVQVSGTSALANFDVLPVGHLQLCVVLVIQVEHVQALVGGWGAARGWHLVSGLIIVIGLERDQGLEQRVVTLRLVPRWTPGHTRYVIGQYSHKDM